ncbi:transporter substrate-binding domain-containing protein [Ideonella sp.]|uniref:transporter substrate-binding domain-containing protein n=1 Tax=Ideonella sp. TaxID=1929293 RepID=UPI003BB76341
MNVKLHAHHRLGLAAALAGLSLAVLAQAPAAPGAGFADPQGIPKRERRADIEPVMRSASIDTLATIRKRGVLRVGVVNTVPMVMHDAQGKLVGFSIDLSRKLAEDLGVEVEWTETSWTDLIPDLLGQQFDLVASGLWMTTPRALVVNFSNPTATEAIYLVGAKSAAAGLPSSASFDKAGVKIAVYADTPQATLAKRLFPKATLLLLKGNEDHLAAVTDGRAQGALVPALSARVLLRSAPDKLYLPRDAQLSVTRTALAVRKGDPDFLNFLNTWLSVQADAGWLEERAAYWSTTTSWMK